MTILELYNNLDQLHLELLVVDGLRFMSRKQEGMGGSELASQGLRVR